MLPARAQLSPRRRWGYRRRVRQDASGRSFVYNLRLPGQYYDVETGLNYNHFRQFDPAVGRYTQSDPIGLFGGIDTYSYADLDPLNAYDPTGLCWSNARAVAHFFGGGGDESVDQIGCWSELTQKVQPARNVWIARVRAAAREKALSLQCSQSTTFQMSRYIGLSSGIFWIGGFSLHQTANCMVGKVCNNCLSSGKGVYWFSCDLTSSMHDQFIDPLDLDNSGRTSHPDFWDHWNLGGTPFYVNGSWQDHVTGGGSL